MGSGQREIARRRSWYRNRNQSRTRPGVDALEGRIVLSTFRASNTAQLVAAIASVNNSNEPNTILLRGGNYFVSHELKIQNAGNLTIKNAQAGAVVNLTGSAIDRVLEINGGNVTLENLNVSGGAGVDRGGGILAQNAALTLKNVRVFNNVVTEAGGGIFAQGGSLDLQNSSVMNNRASNSVQAMGGGIVVWNTATTITSSLINENSVFAVDTSAHGGPVSGTGGGIYAQGGSLSIRRSTLSSNAVFGVTTGTYGATSGGAISTYMTPVTVSNSNFSFNTLTNVSFGTFAIQGSVFSTAGGSLSVSNSTLLKNTPPGWGAFYQAVGANVTVSNSSIDGRRINGTKTL